MGDCESAEMRDALPDLMFGEIDAARRAEVQAHIDTCPECTAELALLKRVRASARVPAVDVNRVVSALPAPRRQTSVFRSPVLRMAAALALMIGGATWYANARDEASPTTSPVQVAGTSVVTPAPLDSALPSVTRQPSVTTVATAPAAKGISLDGGLSDFSDAELQTLLASLDSFESTVTVEPRDVLEPVIESEEVR